MLKYWQIFLILIINSNNNDFFTNKMENFRILNKAVQIFKTSDNENETEDNTKIKDNSNPYWQFYKSFENYGFDDHYRGFILLSSIVSIDEYDDKLDTLQENITQQYNIIMKYSNTDFKEREIDFSEEIHSSGSLCSESHIDDYFYFIYSNGLHDYLDEFYSVFTGNNNILRRLKITKKIFSKLDNEVNKIKKEKKDSKIIEEIEKFNKLKETLNDYTDKVECAVRDGKSLLEDFYEDNERRKSKRKRNDY